MVEATEQHESGAQRRGGGARVDIQAERARIDARLNVLTRPLLNAWADGIGTVTLRKRELEVKDESRALRRRLSALKQLERRRKS